jgi:hypothetical protein
MDPIRVPDQRFLFCLEIHDYFKDVQSALGILVFFSLGSGNFEKFIPKDGQTITSAAVPDDQSLSLHLDRSLTALPDRAGVCGLSYR